MGAGRSKNANLNAGPFPAFNPFAFGCNFGGLGGLNGFNSCGPFGSGLGLGCGLGGLGGLGGLNCGIGCGQNTICVPVPVPVPVQVNKKLYFGNWSI
jgi:hypothetical protein